MPLFITPELGIPLPVNTNPDELIEFRQKAHAYFATVQDLINRGIEVEITKDDKQRSHEIFAKETLPPPAKLTPGVIVNLEAILTHWDQELLDSSRRLRNYVTNKLIEESINEDSRIRLKALELLGKISTVGLFSEKVEVSVTHRSLKDIEGEIAKTLALYVDKPPIDVTPTKR